MDSSFDYVTSPVARRLISYNSSNKEAILHINDVSTLLIIIGLRLLSGLFRNDDILIYFILITTEEYAIQSVTHVATVNFII